jgi:hypothetical protein
LPALRTNYRKNLPDIEKNPLPKIHNVLLGDVGPTIGEIFDLYTQDSSMVSVKMSTFLSAELSAEIADEIGDNPRQQPPLSIVMPGYPGIERLRKNSKGVFCSPEISPRNNFSLGERYPPSPLKSTKSQDHVIDYDSKHKGSARLIVEVKNKDAELGMNNRVGMSRGKNPNGRRGSKNGKSVFDVEEMKMEEKQNSDEEVCKKGDDEESKTPGVLTPVNISPSPEEQNEAMFADTLDRVIQFENEPLGMYEELDNHRDYTIWRKKVNVLFKISRLPMIM